VIEPNRPFRWDLVRPDHLGTLLDSIPEPDLWFLGELIDCAAKVVARSEDGELSFVGRSVDSVFDLLGGALPAPWAAGRADGSTRPKSRSCAPTWPPTA
jgi:hypothetical protein